MSDAPERIWATPDSDGDWLHGFCSNALCDDKGAEYVRAALGHTQGGR